MERILSKPVGSKKYNERGNEDNEDEGIITKEVKKAIKY